MPFPVPISQLSYKLTPHDANRTVFFYACTACMRAVRAIFIPKIKKGDLDERKEET